MVCVWKEDYQQRVAWLRVIQNICLCMIFNMTRDIKEIFFAWLLLLDVTDHKSWYRKINLQLFEVVTTHLSIILNISISLLFHFRNLQHYHNGMGIIRLYHTYFWNLKFGTVNYKNLGLMMLVRPVRNLDSAC